MKATLRAFFNAEKEEKISDKALISRVTAYVVFIVVCLVAMSISAYAYFAYDVSSKNAIITSASYDLSVTPPEDMESANVYEIKNETAEDKEYTFTLSTAETGTTASVGYCKILVKTDVNNIENEDDVQLFYTKPIWLNEDVANDKPATRKVTISVPAGKTVWVTFVAEWGTCAKEPIIDEKVEPIYSVSE